MNKSQLDKIMHAKGFIAALDQSGGSTPKALLDYGISKNGYSNEEEMFDLMHAMRERIATSSCFESGKIFGAILFEQTMDRQISGMGSAEFLWEKKQIVPFLKIDKGLAEEVDGVQLMKPIPNLDALLERAKGHPIFGTKMRSVIHTDSQSGIAAVLDQQFDYAHTVLAAGFVPIIEPEVSVKSLEKEAAEELLKAGIKQRLQTLPPGVQVMLKLSIPSVDGFYSELMRNVHILRVVALSGGYERSYACKLLAKNPGLSASFSRALSQGLSVDQTDREFEATLNATIDQIYRASIT